MSAVRMVAYLVEKVEKLVVTSAQTTDRLSVVHLVELMVGHLVGRVAQSAVDSVEMMVA